MYENLSKSPESLILLDKVQVMMALISQDRGCYK